MRHRRLGALRRHDVEDHLRTEPAEAIRGPRRKADGSLIAGNVEIGEKPGRFLHLDLGFELVQSAVGFKLMAEQAGSCPLIGVFRWRNGQLVVSALPFAIVKSSKRTQ